MSECEEVPHLWKGCGISQLLFNSPCYVRLCIEVITFHPKQCLAFIITNTVQYFLLQRQVYYSASANPETYYYQSRFLYCTQSIDDTYCSNVLIRTPYARSCASTSSRNFFIYNLLFIIHLQVLVRSGLNLPLRYRSKYCLSLRLSQIIDKTNVATASLIQQYQCHRLRHCGKVCKLKPCAPMPAHSSV